MSTKQTVQAKKLTQNCQVLNHLKSGKSITPLEALVAYGVFRLAARIDDLRKRLSRTGSKHTIVTEMVADQRGRRYGRYRMARRSGREVLRVAR